MKNTRVALFAVACISMFYATSCVKEYNVVDNKDIDYTFNVGGDSLAVPLGTTGFITLTDLAGEGFDDHDLVTDELGRYVYLADTVNISGQMADIDADAFIVEDAKTEDAFMLNFGPAYAEVNPVGSPSKVQTPAAINRSSPINLEFKNISDDIVSADYVHFKKGALLEVLFQITDRPDDLNMTELAPELLVIFPSSLKFNDPKMSGNILRISEFTTGLAAQRVTLLLDGIDLSKAEMTGRDMFFTDTVLVRGAVNWNRGAGVSDDKTYDLHSQISFDVKNARPRSLHGRFKTYMPEESDVFSFGMVPLFFISANNYLDLDDPYVVLELKTNTSSGYKTKLSLTPVKNGKHYTDQTGNFEVYVPSAAQDGPRTVRYWLSKDINTVPKDAGYTHVQVDMPSVFHVFPDHLAVRMESVGDSTSEFEYSFDEKFRADVDVMVRIPFNFGQDLYIDYRDTISGMPDWLTKAVDRNNVEIVAEIENYMPLELKLGLEALDADNVKIPIEVNSDRSVAACNADGSASVTTVTFRLSALNGQLIDRSIESLVMCCEFTSNSAVAGMPIGKETGFKVKVKARVPGGVIIDANEYVTKDKEEE